MSDYRVTVVLTTGISAMSEAEAQREVRRVLPMTAEFGPKGSVLPFEVGEPIATKIDWEKEPRP